MAKGQATKIQILSAKHPGILQAVDGMFEKFASLRAVQQMIEREYHESICQGAVATYKNNYWKVHKQMIREQKATMKAVAEIIGEDGLTAGVNALLWQELQTMKAPQLMAFKKILNDGEKLALLKKQFALYAQEHRQKMKERADAAKTTDGEASTGDAAEDYARAQKVVEQVKEIFGIGMTAVELPNQRLLGETAEGPLVSAANRPGEART